MLEAALAGDADAAVAALHRHYRATAEIILADLPAGTLRT